MTVKTFATAGLEGASEKIQEGKYQVKGNTLTINLNDGTRLINNIGMFDGDKKLVVGNKWLTKL